MVLLYRYGGDEQPPPPSPGEAVPWMDIKHCTLNFFFLICIEKKKDRDVARRMFVYSLKRKTKNEGTSLVREHIQRLGRGTNGQRAIQALEGTGKRVGGGA